MTDIAAAMNAKHCATCGKDMETSPGHFAIYSYHESIGAFCSKECEGRWGAGA